MFSFQISILYCKFFQTQSYLSEAIKTKKATLLKLLFCERRRIRTFDRLLRRQVLYPAELCDHYFSVVGVAGFEPAASCSQSRRDNRATLHPEKKAERQGLEPWRRLLVDRLAICSVTTPAPLLNKFVRTYPFLRLQM